MPTKLNKKYMQATERNAKPKDKNRYPKDLTKKNNEQFALRKDTSQYIKSVVI